MHTTLSTNAAAKPNIRKKTQEDLIYKKNKVILYSRIYTLQICELY